MKFFSYLYDKTISWSAHRHAQYYLAGVSFTESCFFPIPPDVMLISMGLAFPQRAWYNALIATIFSVAGGILGYCIGLYAMDLVLPYIMDSSFAPQYLQLKDWLEHCNIWVVILAGFTPFPYKIFTITAGAMHIPFGLFVLGSIVGRGTRFYAVSAILYYFGERLGRHLRRYVDAIGWILLAATAIGICVYKWM